MSILIWKVYHSFGKIIMKPGHVDEDNLDHFIVKIEISLDYT